MTVQEIFDIGDEVVIKVIFTDDNPDSGTYGQPVDFANVKLTLKTPKLTKVGNLSGTPDFTVLHGTTGEYFYKYLVDCFGIHYFKWEAVGKEAEQGEFRVKPDRTV